MVKGKRNVFLVLVMVLVLAMVAPLLMACDGEDKNTDGANNISKEYTITFMQKEHGVGDWKQVASVKSSKDGKVVLPKEPSEDGFTFKGWYLDEACTRGNEFDENKVTADTTVYAFLAEKAVKVNVFDGSGNKTIIEEQKIAELDALAAEQTQKASQNNLTFDGWYVNEACTNKYTPELGATEIFGRYMAVVTFNNGYETLGKPVMVVPGQKLQAPSISDIKKDYMDSEDIYYVNAKGEDFDFDKTAIDENITINILWKTPGLSLMKVNNSANYQVVGFQTSMSKEALEALPVVSIPNRVTINNQPAKVTAVIAGSLYRAINARKFIFNEGIKYISGFSSVNIMHIEQAVLPESLLVLESSFNNMTKLNQVELPSQLEIILDSFWFDADRTKGYENLNVKVPASVTNVSKVPANLDYSDNELFYSDTSCGRVYKNDAKLGKVLVTDVQANVDDSLSLDIPSDIEAIQVGALANISFDFLNLPSSFVAVSYNNDRSARDDYYTGSKLTNLPYVGEPESNPTVADAQMNESAYSVVSNLNKHKYIRFDSKDYPVGMNYYAFNDGKERFDMLADIKVVFVGKVTEGTVDININGTDKVTGEVKTTVITVDVGTVLTQELVFTQEVKEILGMSEDHNIISIKQFGDDYTYGKVDSNLYLDVVYAFAPSGFTYELKDDEAIITGFDVTSAKDITPAESTDIQYQVNIPASIMGKPVTTIGDGAFEFDANVEAKKNSNYISQVLIPASVKTIGARAFKNANRLELVKIAGGGLVSIGEQAFEFAGSDPQDNKKVNELLAKVNGLPCLTIELPLKNLGQGFTNGDGAIGRLAFNSPAIRTFTAVSEEATRQTIKINLFENTLQENLDPNAYYFQTEKGGDKIAIVKMHDKTKNVVQSSGSSFNVYDLDFVCTAAGYVLENTLTLGAVDGGLYSFKGSVYRYNVLKDSIILYAPRGTYGNIQFTYLSKVAKNAVYYLDASYTTINDDKHCGFGRVKPGSKFSLLMTEQDVLKSTLAYSTVDPQPENTQNIFENGWLMGKDNTTNTFITAESLIQGGEGPGL